MNNIVSSASEKNQERASMGKKTAILGILINTLLSASKLFLGVIFGAISVIGDGINNFFDAISSVVTLVGFKISQKPADSDHPYGHGRFEYICAMIVATLILFAGYELAKGSVEKLVNPKNVQFSMLTLAVLIVSVAVKLCLGIIYRKRGKAISSPALRAASKDSFYDAVTTGLVFLAILLENLFDWRLDAVGGLVVSAFIFRGGAGIIKETVDTLMGMAGSPKLRGEIEKVVRKNEKVLGIHDLLIHDYGPGNCFASLHVEFDRREDAGLCHDIIDKIERECLESLSVHLVIHHDPVAIDDEEYNFMQSLLLEILKKYDKRLSLHDLQIEKTESEIKLLFDVDIPDLLSGEKREITQFVNEKLREKNPQYDAHITYDPV